MNLFNKISKNLMDLKKKLLKIYSPKQLLKEIHILTKEF
jgi:hypothetical protein